MWTILGNVVFEQRTTIPRKNHKYYLSHLDYFDFIKMLLKRSRDLDLWISISSTSPKSYINSKAEDPVLALLIEHKDRWAALGIHASFQTVKAICNSEQAGTYSRPFKRLRKLCLGITWGPYDSTIDISRTSLLTEVSIPRVFCPESVPALSYPNVILPFKQLRVYRETTLPISLQPTDTLIQEVRTGGKLEELEILTPDGCFFYLHHHKPEPMNLESLKTLVLRMDPHTDHYDFVELADSSKSLFDMLSLSNLETLKLSGSGVLDPSLASFIHCPSPQASLRKLCLRKLGLWAGHLSKLLQVTPNLEELITDLPEQGDLNRLAVGRSGVGTSVANTTVELLLPKLRGLVFHLRAYEVTYTLLRRHERRPILLLARAVVEGKSIKDGVDWDMAHSSTVEPYFRLVLPDAEAANDAQVDLNMDNYDENASSEGHHDSPEPAGMNTDENTALRNKLFHFRMMLRQALSELKRATTSPLRPQFASDLNTLLQEIEALKLTQGRQIANLYITWLHLSILSLSNVEQKLISEEKKFLFRERTKRLITKWNLIITSDLKNRKIHWAIKGQRSIVYIGRDDVCHGLPQIKDTVYDGLEDNQSSLMDIAWPDPIF